MRVRDSEVAKPKQLGLKPLEDLNIQSNFFSKKADVLEALIPWWHLSSQGKKKKTTKAYFQLQ